jgi:hypothetical protein
MQAPFISAAVVLLLVESDHPLHLLMTSALAAVIESGNRAYDAYMLAAADIPFLNESFYLPVALLSVTLALALLRQCFRGSGSTHAIASSRTVSISEVDDLMMTLACGCDCGPVTDISKVAVAPSPELSFESSHPQLKLDTCDAVGYFCDIACSLFLLFFA